MVYIMLVLTLLSSWCQADVLFEGYAKINAGDRHVGFFIQRYEFDPKKKIFTSTYFIKTDSAGGDITESLKAQANEKFEPMNYTYTSKVGPAIKTVDAKFNLKKNQMSLSVSDGASKKNTTHTLEKGTFLSTFLQYLMLHNGYSVGKKFSYNAIAEEDGLARVGEAFIKEETKLGDQNGFRILNKFKDSEFVSVVTPKGEVLGTASPVQDISTELVKNSADATKGIQYSEKTLRILFGGLPEGKVNVLWVTSKKPTPTQPEIPAPSTPTAPQTTPPTPPKAKDS